MTTSNNLVYVESPRSNKFLCQSITALEQEMLSLQPKSFYVFYVRSESSNLFNITTSEFPNI